MNWGSRVFHSPRSCLQVSFFLSDDQQPAAGYNKVCPVWNPAEETPSLVFEFEKCAPRIHCPEMLFSKQNVGPYLGK